MRLLKDIYRVVRSLFCSHVGINAFVRNIYGDEINEFGGDRSLWYCPVCKTYFSRSWLVENRDENVLLKQTDELKDSKES